MSALPIDTCPACRITYVACPACGNDSRDMDMEGMPCRCRRGILVRKTIRVCCQRHHHHLHKTCPHCGQKG